MNEVVYRSPSDLPSVLPVFPLDGAVLLPGGVLPLQIFEPRYLNMIDDAMAGDRIIGMVQTGAGNPFLPGLARVGCAGQITRYTETGDGRYMIDLTGVCRFETVEELPLPTPYRQVRAGFTPFEDDLEADRLALEFDRAPLIASLRRYLDRKGLAIEWETAAQAPAPILINRLCMILPFEPIEKQALLEAPGLEERRMVLSALLEIDAAFVTVFEDDEDGDGVQAAAPASVQ